MNHMDTAGMNLTIRQDMRVKLIKTLTEFPYRDEYEVLQTASALMWTTAVPEELNELGLVSSMRLLNSLKDRLSTLSDDQGHVSEDVMTVFIETSSHLLTGTANNHNLPPPVAITVVRNASATVDKLLEKKLMYHTAGEAPITRTANHFSVFGSRYQPEDVPKLQIAGVHFGLPSILPGELVKHAKECRKVPLGDSYQVHMMSYDQTPFPSVSHQIETKVASLEFYTASGVDVPLFDFPWAHPFHISLPRHTKQETQPTTFTLYKHRMNVHEFTVTDDNLQQTLHINLDLQQFDEGRLFQVAVLIRRGQAPTNRHYTMKYVYDREVNKVRLFLPAFTFNASASGTYHLGIVDDKFNAGRLREGEVTSRDYNITLWWSQCVYWDETNHFWSGEKCKEQVTSTYDTVECTCNHLTSFGGHIASIPMTKEYMTDYDVEAFFSLEENIVCIALVASVAVVYLVLLTICCWVDKRHKKTETVIYLHDNDPNDLYKYEITLETGFRKGAGTTAKVSVVLHGEEGMSETRELISEIAGQRVFARNSRDIFIMTLPESLGRIWKVQVWHNNEGSSPSWYLSRAIVHNCNTGQNFYFMCEKWFAVEEDDGKVEREIMALDESQLGFTQVFWSKGTQYLADYHLWTSLLTKPEYGTFMRSERLTVCFTLGLMYMCINAIWYQLTEQLEYRGEFGLLDLSWYSVVVGVGCSLCVIPIGLLLGLIFRRSNVKRQKRGGGVEEKYKSIKQTEETSSDTHSVSVQPIMTQSLIDQSIIHWQSLQEWAQKQWEKRYQKSMSSSESVKPEVRHEIDQASSGFEDYMSQDQSHMMSFSNQSSETKSEKSSSSDDKPDSITTSMSSSSTGSMSQPQLWFLPFWFRYVAWILCILISVGCGGVTVMYGFRFGKTKSVMWLQSLYFSLLVCVFISHPLMILLITLYTALRYRNNPVILNTKLPTYDSEDEQEAMEKQQASRTLLFENCSELERGIAARQRSRYLRFARPPQEKQLIKARKATMKEKKLYSMLWDGFGFIILLVLLTIMAFAKDSWSAYSLNESVTRTFVHQGSPSLSQLKTIPDWWTWSQTTLMDKLYASPQYDISQHKQHLLPIPDSSCVIVGCVNIRQLRVKQQACNLDPSYHLPEECRYGYAQWSKTTEQYGNWSYDEQEVGNSIMGRHGWYEGQGYVFELPRTRVEAEKLLRSMENDQWIDLKTRAVIVEFTLFNAPTNLSTSVALVYERPAIGQGFSYHRVKSTYVYRYISTLDHFLLSCELLYILVVVIRLKNVCGELLHLQKKFFWNPWNVLEIIFITVSLTYAVCFVYRFSLVAQTVEHIRATYHEKFVDISYLALWDDVIKVFVGLMLFMTLLKFLQMLRYRKLFARFGNVMKRASKDLLVFLLCFLIWLFAYSSLGVGLFSAVSRNFRDLWTAMLSVSAMMVQGYDMKDVEEQRTVMSAIFMVLFMVTAFAMLFSYVVAILSYHYRDYKQEDILCMSTHEALVFLWQKLKLWCRIDEPNEPDEDDGELPAEFTMAEIEYQVDELMFKMNALTGSTQLPDKPPCYYTDSDGTYRMGDDGISSGGSEVRPFDEERFEKRIHQIEQNLYSHEPHLAQLIHLDNIGANKLSEDKEKQLWSALELEIFRQLQLHRQENKPSSEYHSNSSGSYGNNGGNPYSASLSYSPSHNHRGDDQNEAFMMTEMKREPPAAEAANAGEPARTSEVPHESPRGRVPPEHSKRGASSRKQASKKAAGDASRGDASRTPSNASTSSSEYHYDVRPKYKLRPNSSPAEKSTTFTNHAYLCDSSSDGEAPNRKVKADVKKTLRKTKSRGRGKGDRRLTEPDGLDDLGVDNEAFSSDDEGKTHQAWM